MIPLSAFLMSLNTPRFVPIPRVTLLLEEVRSAIRATTVLVVIIQWISGLDFYAHAAQVQHQRAAGLTTCKQAVRLTGQKPVGVGVVILAMKRVLSLHRRTGGTDGTWGLD